ncbi:MAG: hypothetical protein GY711_29645, partial [bacterium]|nr:hypothetical protein [bacterium]
ADVYSLGATFHEVLTGHPLFDGDSEARLMHQVVHEDPVPVRRRDASIPADLETIIGKALEKDASLRHDTAAALAADLDAFLAGEPISARAPSVGYLVGLAVRRHRGVAVTVAVAAAAVVLLTTAFVVSLKGERDTAEEERAAAVLSSERASRAEKEARTRAAEAERERAVARSVALALEARAAARSGRWGLARLLAVEAVSADESPTTVSALHDLFRGPTVSAAIELAGLPLSARPTPAGDGLVTVAGERGRGIVQVWSLDGKERARIEGPKGAMRTATLSPDGSLIATASDGSVATLWSLSGERIADLAGHTDDVLDALFTPDGRRVVTASQDGTARVFTASGVPVATIAPDRGELRSLAISPDGKRVLVGCLDGGAHVWGIDGTPLLELPDGGEFAAEIVAFSADGERILTAGASSARLWTERGEPVAELGGSTYAGRVMLRSAAFSPDGTHVVTSWNDGTARIWDADGVERAALVDDAVIEAAAFSPDGRRVVTGSITGTMRVWNLSGGLLRTIRDGERVCRDLAFLAGGRILFNRGSIPGHGIRLWDWIGGGVRALRAHSSAVDTVAVSPFDGRIVTASTDGAANLWSPDGVHVAELAGHDGMLSGAQFSPTGGLFATLQINVTTDAAAPGPVRVWDADGRLRLTLVGGDDTADTVSFAPDGTRIVTSDRSGPTHVWDMAGKELAATPNRDRSDGSACFSPAGDALLTSGREAVVERALDGSVRRTIVTRTGGDHALVAVSCDGRRIATAVSGPNDAPCQIELHEPGAAAGAPSESVAGMAGPATRATRLIFSARSSHLLAMFGDDTAQLWSPDGVELGSFPAFTDVAVSPDGRLVATIRRDSATHLYRADGSVITSLEWSDQAAWSVAFSAGGRFVLTGCNDGVVRWWHTSTAELVNDTVRAAGRTELTDSERLEYGALLDDPPPR